MLPALDTNPTFWAGKSTVQNIIHADVIEGVLNRRVLHKGRDAANPIQHSGLDSAF